MNTLTVDLRSDTVTKPMPHMLTAMLQAQVGDDVLGDDPTVTSLQNRVAELLGKEAALFMPSGTMANQVALRTHTEAGDEVIMEATGHTFMYETGAMGALCGVQAQLIAGQRGIITPDQIKKAIRPKQTYVPPTKLVILENTHNHGGGTVYPLPLLEDIYHLCQNENIPVHLDGARLWNASVATGTSLKDYAKLTDSVSVCLSKGLGAPVGSVIAGTRTWIERAQRFRKMFGGGMRQAGYLAAAGLYALENNIDRLKHDHHMARELAARLAEIKNIIVNPTHVETNILFFGVRGKNALTLAAELKKENIHLFPLRDEEVRAVTHMHITAEHIDRVAQVMHTLAV